MRNLILTGHFSGHKLHDREDCNLITSLNVLVYASISDKQMQNLEAKILSLDCKAILGIPFVKSLVGVLFKAKSN